MGKAAVSLALNNGRAIVAAIQTMPKQLRKRALSDALRRAGRLLVNRAKAYAPVDKTASPSGTLRRSIGLVIRRPKGKKKDNLDPYVVIGPQKGKIREVVRGDGRSEQADPVNYAHLVELGHHIVTGGTLTDITRSREMKGQRASRVEGRTGMGRSVVFVEPKPFIRPAMKGGRFESLSSIAASLKSFMKREAERVRKAAERKAARLKG